MSTATVNSTQSTVLTQLAPVAAALLPAVAQDPDDARLPKILAAVNSCTTTPLTEDNIRKMVQAAKAAKAANVPIQAPLKLKRKENAHLKRNIFLTPDGKCRILMTCTQLGDKVISNYGAFKIIKTQVVINLDIVDVDPEVEAVGVCKKKRIELASPDTPWATVQQDFQYEAEVLETFRGKPEIVQTTFFAAEAEKSYLGMELCDGDLHDEVVTSGAFATKTSVEKLQMVHDCAQAVAALHGSGFIYRDLKLDNFLMKKGKVKLTDFGMVCGIDDVARRSITAGSPGWLAPERAKAFLTMMSTGDTTAIVETTTQPSDLFVLGMLYYVMFTAKFLPFQDGFNPLFKMSQLTDSVVINSINISSIAIPGDMALLIKKMVKCDPTQRPTIAEVIAALDTQIAAANS